MEVFLWGKSSKKNQIFYGQASVSLFLGCRHFQLDDSLVGQLTTVRLTVMGGVMSAPSALTISKCENFGPFFPLKFDSLILKTNFISLWRVFHLFHLSWPFCGCKCSYGGTGILQVIIQKIVFFFCKIHFRTYMFIIWGQKHNKRNHEKQTVTWGGGRGSMLTVSLTVKHLFFDDFSIARLLNQNVFS